MDLLFILLISSQIYITALSTHNRFNLGTSIISLNSIPRIDKLGSFSDDESLKKDQGKDMRYPDEELNAELLHDIHLNMERKKVLQILQNENTSLPYKIETIKKYEYLINFGEKIFNLYAGGLMHEYDFWID